MAGSAQARPDIAYPCLWSFRVIGEEREAVAAAIAAVAGAAEHLLTYGQASSRGRYHSFTLEIMVASEGHRNNLYRALAGAEVVKFVL